MSSAHKRPRASWTSDATKPSSSGANGRTISSWLGELTRLVYGDLIALIVRSFTGGSHIRTEAAIRGKVAIWGGADLVEATSTWVRFASYVTSAGGDLEPEQKREANRLVGQIVDAARKDLGEQQTAIPDRHAVLAMIFNDYEAT